MASVAERYILLGLRLGRHVEGLVDGYYGPAELKEAVDAEDLVAREALLEEARALAAALDDVEDTQRRRWLAAQVQGLECVAEMLCGTEVSWSDAVRRCYGVDVSFTPEERFAEAHALFDEALPGGGDLGERLQAWNRAQELPSDKLLPAFHALVEELRAATRGIVDLPDGEQFDVETVTGQPWGAYNWYLGDLASRIEVNTDLPVRAHMLASLVAHEGYPGHHTEHACKEARLVRGLDRTECSILLIHTPECLVSEGIATIALEQAFGDDAPERIAAIYEPLGISYEPETVRAVQRASELLDGVTVNVAYSVAERGWTKDEAVEYLKRWTLTEDERARKSVEFQTHPVWSIYVPTYVYGYRLARAFASGDGHFSKLLTEQLTTADLRERTTAAPSA